MAKRAVKWTKTAEIQYVGILEYWTKRNQSNAYSKKLIGVVAELTKLIAETPLIFRATDFRDTRVASMGHFSLFYKVTKRHIIVTAFWDNRQDLKKLLEILQKNGND